MPWARRAPSTASRAPTSTPWASCPTAPSGNPDDLRTALLADPVPFVQTLTERLMMYALGRVIESHDMPFVRGIVRKSAADDYRFATLVTGIVTERRVHQGARAGAEGRGAGDQAGRSH